MTTNKESLPNLQIIILDHRRVELENYLKIENANPGTKSYYSFVDWVNSLENSPMSNIKIFLTIFVPFKIQHSLNPSTIKITEHPMATVNLFFNNTKINSIKNSSSNKLEINFVLDLESLSSFTSSVQGKKQINIVIPVDTMIVPETLEYLYNYTNNTSSNTNPWIGLKSNILYSNLESTNRSIMTKCSCFDQLQVIYNYSKNVFNGDHIISYIAGDLQHNPSPSVLLDQYRFKQILPPSKHVIVNRITPYALTDITPNFSEFNHFLPTKFIDEKIYNVPFWVHEYKKCGNYNFGRMHLWRIIMSLSWLFFVYGLLSSVPYLQSIVFYVCYIAWLAIPQILKKNYFKSDVIKNLSIIGNLNNVNKKNAKVITTDLRVRRTNDIFVPFDWKLLMLYYLTPVDSIVLILTSGMTLLLYMLGF